MTDTKTAEALASGIQGLAADLRDGEDEADDLLGQVQSVLRALAAERDALRAALGEIKVEVGTSTKAWHIADAALNAKPA